MRSRLTFVQLIQGYRSQRSVQVTGVELSSNWYLNALACALNKRCPPWKMNIDLIEGNTSTSSQHFTKRKKSASFFMLFLLQNQFYMPIIKCAAYKCSWSEAKEITCLYFNKHKQLANHMPCIDITVYFNHIFWNSFMIAQLLHLFNVVQQFRGCHFWKTGLNWNWIYVEQM